MGRSAAKRMLLILTVFVTSVFLVGEALGANPLTDSGRVAVVVHGTDDVPVPGATVTIYRVGRADLKNNTIMFSPASVYAAPDIAFDNVTSARNLTLAELLAAKVKENNAQGLSATTNAMGRVMYGNVRPGVYLIVQTGSKSAASRYETMAPFLAFVPHMDPASGTWQRNVFVYPKMTAKSSNATNGNTNKTRKRRRLPKTGEIVWPTYALAGGGLALIAAGYWVRKRRKKDETDR